MRFSDMSKDDWDRHFGIEPDWTIKMDLEALLLAHVIFGAGFVLFGQIGVILYLLIL